MTLLPSAPPDPSPESRLDQKYTLLEELGRGGFGVVYRAQQIATGQVVAIKMLSGSFGAQDPKYAAEQHARFWREVKLIGRLRSPYIVSLIDAGIDQGQPYMVLEFINGHTLSKLIDSLPLTPPTTKRVMSQVLEAVAVAHDLGVVHRDLKPDNIMLMGEGNRVTAKVLDFGIAGIRNAPSSPGTPGTPSSPGTSSAANTAISFESVTVEGQMRGTPAYMAPEQLLFFATPRPESDVYALGLITLECLTGSRAVDGASMQQICFKQMNEPLPIPAFLQNTPWSKLIERACNKNPDARFRSAGDMLQALSLIDDALDLTAADETAEFQMTRSDVAALLKRLSIPPTKAVSSPNPKTPSVDTAPTLSNVLDLSPHPPLDPPTDPDDPNRTDQEIADTLDPDDDPSDTPTVLSPLPPVPPTAASSNGKRAQNILIGAAVVLVAVIVWAALHLSSGNEPDPSSSASTEADPATSPETPPKLTGPEIVLGWPPAIDPALLKKEVDPLRTYLERQLKQPVRVEVPPDYATLSRMLREGALDFALVTPLLTVRTLALEPRVHMLATRTYDGATSTDAYLVVMRDGPIHTLRELDGKRFCFVDVNSTTGYFLPYAYIAESGFNPDTFIGAIHWSGNHQQVLRDLLSGQCDAAALTSSAWINAENQGIQTSLLRILTITGQSPQDSFCASPFVPQATQDAVQQAILTFDPYALNLERLGYGLTTFIRPRPELFVPLRSAQYLMWSRSLTQALSKAALHNTLSGALLIPNPNE